MSYYDNWYGYNKGGGKSSSNRSAGFKYGSYYEDDYYSGSSYYGNNYGSSWNWGTFGYSSIVEDNDDDLYMDYMKENYSANEKLFKIDYLVDIFEEILK